MTTSQWCMYLGRLITTFRIAKLENAVSNSMQINTRLRCESLQVGAKLADPGKHVEWYRGTARRGFLRLDVDENRAKMMPLDRASATGRAKRTSET